MKKRIIINLFSFIFLTGLIILSGFIQPQQNEKWIAPSYTDTLHNPMAMDEASIVSAKKIYNNVCWTCHGLEGKGNGPASTTCKPKPADHTSAVVQHQSDGALFWKITTGRGIMQPYAKLLSSKQRWMLVNYIRTLSVVNRESKLN